MKMNEISKEMKEYFTKAMGEHRGLIVMTTDGRVTDLAVGDMGMLAGVYPSESLDYDLSVLYGVDEFQIDKFSCFALKDSASIDHVLDFMSDYDSNHCFACNGVSRKSFENTNWNLLVSEISYYELD